MRGFVKERRRKEERKKEEVKEISFFHFGTKALKKKFSFLQTGLSPFVFLSRALPSSVSLLASRRNRVFSHSPREE